MFKFIGRAIAGLILTKDARQAVGRRPSPASPGKGKSGSVPAGSRDQAIAEMQKGAQDLLTPDRAELIRQAMRVRAAKQTILADLDDETRGKLVATAMKALLKETKREE
jgi:hypothetical protein